MFLFVLESRSVIQDPELEPLLEPEPPSSSAKAQVPSNRQLQVNVIRSYQDPFFATVSCSSKHTSMRQSLPPLE